MAKRSTAVTKTLGPIHFEDLEPHRFEDLVRELVYDYRDWQSIEATGRTGGDEGFDIRAFEKSFEPIETGTEEEEEPIETHLVDGNQWMIQGKREKEIGPTKLRSILDDVNAHDPPYGYILAAPVNFSKRAYDVFREELRKRGVMEFYLWGKAALEDMLHLPKNDHILFTFFGISLVTRRRSRTTEVRSAIAIKNKLFRALGERHQMFESVLVRDLNDTHYPFKGQCPDFDKRPAWREYIAFEHNAAGLVVHAHEYFAYIDHQRKEWDYTEAVDLLNRQVENDDERREGFNRRQLVEGFWKFLPRSNQARFEVDSLLRYTDIAIVDDKGDSLHRFPHIYIDRAGKETWFSYGFERLVRGEEKTWLTDDYKRVEVFPKVVEKGNRGKIHAGRPVALDAHSINDLSSGRLHALFDTNGRYAYLAPRDVVPVANAQQRPSHLQVTHKESTNAKEYLDRQFDSYGIRTSMEHQLGRPISDDELINVVEIIPAYKHQVDDAEGG